MKKDVLEERDAAIKEKRNALEDRVINLLLSDRFAFTYLLIALALSITYFIRAFSDIGYDRTTRCIEATVLWMATFRYYIAKRLDPDSRATRWWFRIVFIASVLSTIHWILGMPGPRLPWKDR